MEAAGLSKHRDAFVEFAVDYDHDDNGYLKKAELEDAAKAWNEAHSDGETEEARRSTCRRGRNATTQNGGRRERMPICST